MGNIAVLFSVLSITGHTKNAVIQRKVWLTKNTVHPISHKKIDFLVTSSRDVVRSRVEKVSPRDPTGPLMLPFSTLDPPTSRFH